MISKRLWRLDIKKTLTQKSFQQESKAKLFLMVALCATMQKP